MGHRSQLPPSDGAIEGHQKDHPLSRSQEWNVPFRKQLEQLFRNHYLPLRAKAQQIVGRQEEAEEVVQTVFAEVWERREFLRQGYLKAYIYRAVRSRALDGTRSDNTRREKIVLTSSHPADSTPAATSNSKNRSAGRPDDEVQADELAEAINHAVGSLPPRRRQVYVMSRREGRSNAEIADLLELKIKTIEMHLWRALRDLRKAIAPLLPKGSPYLPVLIVASCHLAASL